MKRFFDVKENKSRYFLSWISFAVIIMLIGALIMPHILSKVFYIINRWDVSSYMPLHVFYISEGTFCILGLIALLLAFITCEACWSDEPKKAIYGITKIELDKESIVIYKKDQTFKINQEDIIDFRVISNKDLTIKILTKNENIEIKAGIEWIKLFPFLLEMQPFINNCSIDCSEIDKETYSDKYANTTLAGISKYIFTIIFCGYFTWLYFCGFHINGFVMVEDVEKANKIQDLITIANHPILRDYNKSGTVSLSLFGGKQEINRAIVRIANSEYFDKDDVHFLPSYRYEKSKKKVDKIIKKRLKNIPGVFDVDVISNNSLTDIIIHTSDDFDKDEIKKIATNIIIDTSEILYKEENINITFTDYKKANKKLISKHKEKYMQWLH